MLHDETDYPEPFSFKPERFLKNGKLNPEVKDPATAAFGFGRRICPVGRASPVIIRFLNRYYRVDSWQCRRCG
jgi:hypothetical protein